MYTVYVLVNRENKKIYIGQTGDIEKRLEEHNTKRGNHFTAKFGGTWELAYKEEVTDRREARVRERQLKSYRGRQFIKKYIPS